MVTLFEKPSVGAVALVEQPVSQWYTRRARVTGLCVGLAVDGVVSAAASVFFPLLVALVLGALAGMVAALCAAVLVRVWPVLRVLWWWSLEITAGLLLVAVPVGLAHVTAWWVALPVVVLLLGGGVVSGPVRRFMWAWSWCVVDRHRLRTCFAGFVRGTNSGSRPAQIPFVLWAQPTPAGERVWMWLRPGLALPDLDGKTPRIATGCWAKDVRVVGASERSSALVRVDITRRDPLSSVVTSPLALLVPSLRAAAVADVPVSPVGPLVGLDLADIPDPAPEPARSSGGRR